MGWMYGGRYGWGGCMVGKDGCIDHDPERISVSHLRLGEGDLHFAAGEGLVVEVGDGLEAVLHRVELDQGHVLLVGVAEDLDGLHLAVLAEDVVERVLLADLLLQRAHVQRLRGRVHRQRAVRGETE